MAGDSPPDEGLRRKRIVSTPLSAAASRGRYTARLAARPLVRPRDPAEAAAEFFRFTTCLNRKAAYLVPLVKNEGAPGGRAWRQGERARRKLVLINLLPYGFSVKWAGAARASAESLKASCDSGQALEKAQKCARRSWRDPADGRSAQVRGSARLLASVAGPSATSVAKRTQQSCGVWESHEILNIAGAEAVFDVEGNMCGAAMRSAVALPGSKATSRTKGSRRNLGGLTPGHRPWAVLVRMRKVRNRSA